MEDTRACPTGTIRLTHQTATKLVPATCGRWSCGSCGPRKARRLRRRLTRTTPTRLITLTLRPNPAASAREELARANRAWSILWRRYKRQFGDAAVGYAKIVELTKAGTPHLHIIAEMPYVPQRSLSAAWNALTGSYVVDIRRVRSRNGIGGYLTSYLTKALAVPEGMRKWSAARGWVPPEEHSELEPGEMPPAATFARSDIESLRKSYREAGYVELDGWLFPPGALPAALAGRTHSPPAPSAL